MDYETRSGSDRASMKKKRLRATLARVIGEPRYVA
jgi:hypothetical protein